MFKEKESGCKEESVLLGQLEKEAINKKQEVCSLVLASQGTKLIVFGLASIRKLCLSLVIQTCEGPFGFIHVPLKRGCFSKMCRIKD